MQALNSMMRRFTIQTRMIGAIVMVVVLLLLVGGAGLGGMFRIQSLSREGVEAAFTQTAHLAAIEAQYGRVRRYEKETMISYENAAKVAEYKKLWKDSLAALNTELKGLQDGGLDTANAAVATEFAKHMAAYQSGFEPLVAQIESNAFDTATAINKVSQKPQQEAKLAEGQLDQLQTLLLADANHAESAMTAAASFTLAAFCAALVAACVLVVPLTLLNSRSIVAPIREARTLAQAIAAGDLTATIEVRGNDEASQLLGGLKAMQDSLRHLVGQLRESAESITTASAEVASGNQDLSQRTEEAASSLQQTSSAMTQLTGTVRQSADAASQANQLASSASSVASRGGQVVAQVVATMDEINTSSKKIADIIGVIDGIAFQTNILALNAAVEAARAGEQGRGFAVVAGEVRSLAQRSAEAAKEIKALIGSSVDKVETGARLVEDAGSTMSEIVASVQRVSDIIGEITAASAEQSGGIGQVNTAVMQLDQMTQQNAALVEQSTAAAESLKEQAQKLSGVVATFRVASTVASSAQFAPVRPVAPTPFKAAGKPAGKARAVTSMAAAAPSHKKVAAQVIARASKPVNPPVVVAAAKPAPNAAPAAEGDWETF